MVCLPPRAPHPRVRQARLLRLIGSLLPVLATGCYMAAVDTAAPQGTDTDPASSSNSGSTTGQVEGARGILEHNDFKLYWEHYDGWEQGACTRLRLKNEGGDVQGWELDLTLSASITTWIDAGGAFMWLVDDHLTIEQEQLATFSTWESVEMYYCAEPAVELEGFTAAWQSGDRSSSPDDTGSGSTTGDAELPTLEGELPFTSDGGSALFSWESYATGSYTCLNFAMTNTTDTPAAIVSFDVQLSNATEFVYETGGAVLERNTDTLSFLFDQRDALEPGAARSGRVCMVAMAQPVAVLDVRFD